MLAVINSAIYYNLNLLNLIKSYLRFTTLLENITMNIRQKCYQQDRALSCNSLLVRYTLNKKFPERWIGRNGFTKWPRRSSNLTSLDFFVGACKRIYS